VVEDDPAIADVIAAYLTRAGYRPELAATEMMRWKRAQRVAPRLVLLDLMLRIAPVGGVP